MEKKINDSKQLFDIYDPNHENPFESMSNKSEEEDKKNEFIGKKITQNKKKMVLKQNFLL